LPSGCAMRKPMAAVARLPVLPLRASVGSCRGGSDMDVGRHQVIERVGRLRARDVDVEDRRRERQRTANLYIKTSRLGGYSEIPGHPHVTFGWARNRLSGRSGRGANGDASGPAMPGRGGKAVPPSRCRWRAWAGPAEPVSASIGSSTRSFRSLRKHPTACTEMILPRNLQEDSEHA
jgi:hypothetical protein